MNSECMAEFAAGGAGIDNLKQASRYHMRPPRTRASHYSQRKKR